MTVFLDTNVLAYQFDDAVPAKQETARDILVDVAAEAWISTQVQIELHSVLTRRFGLPRSDAQRALGSLELEVLPTDARLVHRAADLATDRQLSIFDALIVEAAAAAGCDELWTEDLNAGEEIRGVRIVDPFAG